MELNRWKCSPYWPDSNSAVYGDISVELLHCENVSSYTVRTLRIHHMVSMCNVWLLEVIVCI